MKIITFGTINGGVLPKRCAAFNALMTTTLTRTQQNALHLWFELVAEELNAGGFTVQLVLKEKVDIDWNKTLVKDLLWRSAQTVILGKSSTTELKKTEDIDKVFDHLNRHL